MKKWNKQRLNYFITYLTWSNHYLITSLLTLPEVIITWLLHQETFDIGKKRVGNILGEEKISNIFQNQMFSFYKSYPKVGDEFRRNWEYTEKKARQHYLIARSQEMLNKRGNWSRKTIHSH